MTTLTDLSSELLRRIFYHIYEEDLCNILVTCRFLHKYRSNDMIWSKYYKTGVRDMLLRHKIYKPNAYIEDMDVGLTYYRSIKTSEIVVVKDRVTCCYGKHKHLDMILCRVGSNFYTFYNGINIQVIKYKNDINIHMKTSQYETKIDCEYKYEVMVLGIESVNTNIVPKFKRNEKGHIVYELKELMNQIEPHWKCFVYNSLVFLLEFILDDDKK
jgi:hypothetical protein